MKLLFDQNLSYKLARSFSVEFPGSAHVRDLGLALAIDIEVWEYAKRLGFTIVSKDTDFSQRGFLFGPPPKGYLDTTWKLLNKRNPGRSSFLLCRDSTVWSRSRFVLFSQLIQLPEKIRPEFSSNQAPSPQFPTTLNRKRLTLNLKVPVKPIDTLTFRMMNIRDC